jgi:hypothetical protein
MQATTENGMAGVRGNGCVMSQQEEHENKTNIFLSYASEDDAVAKVLETAFVDLSGELGNELKVTRDVHSFVQGRPLRDEVLDNLELADVLFIIYTEALKKSHSWTGFEIGAFTTFIRMDKKQFTKTDRQLVSVYLDDPPAPGTDFIGIKLDPRLFAAVRSGQRGRLFEQSEQIKTFLYGLANLVINRRFEAKRPFTVEVADDMAKVKDHAHKFIDGMVPTLEHELLTSLSGVVARSSIEQRLFTIHWDPTNGGSPEEPAFLEGAELTTEKDAANAFPIFGIGEGERSVTWPDFKSRLNRDHPTHSPFIINAFQNAIRSGFSSGPVDNEQFFLSPEKKLYRIIVTRHYAYYDGSRYVHMYFIPMLSRFEEGDVSYVLALLNVVTRYRTTFLDPESDISLRKFVGSSYSLPVFKEKVERFIREFLLIEDESHVYRLDDSDRYLDIHKDADPTAVAEMFKEWRSHRDGLIEAASQMQRQILGDDRNETKFHGQKKLWDEQLRSFNDYVEPLNKSVGVETTDLLRSWFETGKLEAHRAGSDSKKPQSPDGNCGPNAALNPEKQADCK